jgi:hypothetical protein
VGDPKLLVLLHDEPDDFDDPFDYGCAVHNS